MTKAGHTDNFSVIDYFEKIARYLGDNTLDYVIYNNEKPSEELVRRYAEEGEHPVRPAKFKLYPQTRFIGVKLLAKKIFRQKKGDPMKRTLIRHDKDKLAKLIFDLK
jgi:2-phospho-L-lactate transferase/gluconeogenesis factor (CofD/UPF0052 family)